MAQRSRQVIRLPKLVNRSNYDEPQVDDNLSVAKIESRETPKYTTTTTTYSDNNTNTNDGINPFSILQYAIIAVLALTIITIILRQCIFINDAVASIHKTKLSHENRLGLEHCVFKKHPNSDRFQDVTKVRKILNAGFKDCDEAETFIANVHWHYLHAIFNRYSLCGSYIECKDVIYSFVVYIMAFGFVGGVSITWVIPFILNILVNAWLTYRQPAVTAAAASSANTASSSSVHHIYHRQLPLQQRQQLISNKMYVTEV